MGKDKKKGIRKEVLRSSPAVESSRAMTNRANRISNFSKGLKDYHGASEGVPFTPLRGKK